MLQIMWKFLVREKIYVYAAIVLLLFFGAATPFVTDTISHFETLHYQDRAQDIYTRLKTDNQGVYALARMIGTQPQVQDWIQTNDALSALAYITDTKDKFHIDNIAITDGQGFVLARATSALVRVDKIFLSTIPGRAVAQGQSFSGVTVGIVSPLVLGSGYPITDGSTMQGAVFVSRYLSDSFANTFKKEVGNKVEVIFYSNDKGVVGSSFTDPAEKDLFNRYFSVGSDWIQNSKTDTRINVPFGNKYFVQNIVFPGPQDHKAIGGMLILFPETKPLLFAGFCVEVVSVALLVLIFFCIKKIFRRKFKDHKHNTILHLFVVSAVGFIYVLAIFIYNTRGYYLTVGNVPYTIYNSTFSLSPNSQVSAFSENQIIKVVANSGGEAVNAFDAVIDYDPTLISIDSISTDNSICPQAFFIEKAIDPTRGEVDIQCGIPTPGFTGNGGEVAELNISHKKTGVFSLIFASTSQILANDGLGTDVLRYSEDGSYQVSKKDDDTIEVYSLSNPDAEKWYNSRKVSFNVLPCDDCTYSYMVNQVASDTPGVYTTLASTTWGFNVPADGEYFLHVAQLVDGDTQSTHAALKFLVDATIPQGPTIKASTLNPRVGETVRFVFSGSDQMSGLQKNFYVSTDGGTLLPIGSSLFTAFNTSGKHTVRVRIYDLAGNYSDNSLVINVK